MRGGVGKARPKKAELRRRFFGYAAPIPQKLIPGKNSTGMRARRDFGVNKVAQPKQPPCGERETVPLPHGKGDFERRANRNDDTRPSFHASQNLEPEGRETTDPGILKDKERLAVEFLFEYLLGAFFKGGGSRGLVQ